MAKYGRFDSNNKKKNRDKYKHEIKKTHKIDRERENLKRRSKNLTAMYMYSEE